MNNNPFEAIDARLSNIESLLLDLHKNPESKKTDPQDNDLMTVPELCEMLTLSTTTVYTLTSTKRIPFYKTGKRVYFSRKEINDWIKAGKRKMLTEIEQDAEAYFLNKKGRKNG